MNFAGARFLILDGKPYLWSELVRLRREQLEAARRASASHQLALFEIKHDCRPSAERKASARYLQPTLFQMEAPEANT
jgi:hypothetical protein